MPFPNTKYMGTKSKHFKTREDKRRLRSTRRRRTMAIVGHRNDMVMSNAQNFGFEIKYAKLKIERQPHLWSP